MREASCNKMSLNYRSRFLPFVSVSHVFNVFISRRTEHPLKGWSPDATSADAGTLVTLDDGALVRADPFLFGANGKLFLFYELIAPDSERGCIGVAESTDGRRWVHKGQALVEPFHLSFPFLFEWNDEIWMVPETHQANHVCLYRATEFPVRWQLHSPLLDLRASDSVLFEHDGSWYMFTSPNMKTLLLFHAESPLGPWREHPMNPIVTNDLVNARPAGRVFSVDGKLFRVAQDCNGVYGRKVSSFEILELSPSHYREKPNGPVPGLGPGPEKWRRGGMHHVDALPMPDGTWLVAVDGWRKSRQLRPERMLAALRGKA